MHHTQPTILTQLGDFGRLTLSLADGDSAWNPRSTLSFRGPLLQVTYLLRPDGSVQANTACSSCGTHNAGCLYEDDDGGLHCAYGDAT